MASQRHNQGGRTNTLSSTDFTFDIIHMNDDRGDLLDRIQDVNDMEQKVYKIKTETEKIEEHIDKLEKTAKEITEYVNNMKAEVDKLKGELSIIDIHIVSSDEEEATKEENLGVVEVVSNNNAHLPSMVKFAKPSPLHCPVSTHLQSNSRTYLKGYASHQ
jgi:septal ring factor EnvC (AmiA/AmiB activator)